MGRKRKSDAQKQWDAYQRKLLRMEDSPRGKYVINQLRLRGIHYRRIGPEKFAEWCNYYKYEGKEKLNQSLDEEYGRAIPLMAIKNAFAIEDREVAIPADDAIVERSPLISEKLDRKTLKKIIKKLSQTKLNGESSNGGLLVCQGTPQLNLNNARL